MTSVSITADTSGLDKMRNWISKMISGAPPAAESAVRLMANDLVAKVQENASGRPGPEVVTGAYRASIQVVSVTTSSSGSQAEVGTNEPQAQRLENGFVGTDSAGRHYQQPPFPHWRPAVQYIAADSQKYGKAMMGDLK